MRWRACWRSPCVSGRRGFPEPPSTLDAPPVLQLARRQRGRRRGHGEATTAWREARRRSARGGARPRRRLRRARGRPRDHLRSRSTAPPATPSLGARDAPDASDGPTRRRRRRRRRRRGEAAKETTGGAISVAESEQFGAGVVGGAPGTVGEAGAWAWERAPQPGSREALAEAHSFYGRLARNHPADGAPVAVWRLGSVDWAGVSRESLQPEVTRLACCHFEKNFLFFVAFAFSFFSFLPPGAIPACLVACRCARKPLLLFVFCVRFFRPSLTGFYLTGLPPQIRSPTHSFSPRGHSPSGRAASIEQRSSCGHG